VALAQSVLGRQARDRGGVVGLERLAAPQAQRGGGRRGVTLRERASDGREARRRAEEPERAVEEGHLEYPEHDRVDGGGQRRDERHRDQHRGHQRGPGDDARVPVAGVEPLGGRQAHPPIESEQRLAPRNGLGVLREERGEEC
jgi:hypothetical protein